MKTTAGIDLLKFQLASSFASNGSCILLECLCRTNKIVAANVALKATAAAKNHNGLRVVSPVAILSSPLAKVLVRLPSMAMSIACSAPWHTPFTAQYPGRHVHLYDDEQVVGPCSEPQLKKRQVSPVSSSHDALHTPSTLHAPDWQTQWLSTQSVRPRLELQPKILQVPGVSFEHVFTQVTNRAISRLAHTFPIFA